MKQRTLGIILLFFAVVLSYYFILKNDLFLITAIMLIMVLWLQLSGGWRPTKRRK